MAGRKRRSIEEYGKRWSIVDLDNLKDTVKLLKELQDLQDNFANSLSGSAKILNNINRKTEIQIKLRERNNKLTLEQNQHLVDELSSLQQSNDELDETKDTVKEIMFNANKIANQAKKDPLTLNNAGSYIVGNIQKNKATKLYDEYIKQGKTNDEAINLAANKMAESANKYSIASGLIQTAANTFKSAASQLWSMISSGASEQVGIYNSTFTNIAARTGTTKSGYNSAWTGLNNELFNRNLQDNVSSADVMRTWNTLASEGININLNSEEGIQKAYAKSIETVITQTIVPYLNASDAYFQQLTDLQPSLINQVRGIGITTNEISGSSVVVNKYLETMIKDLSPISRMAEQDLGVQYAKSLGTYESLRSQGVSDYSIGQMYSMTESIVNDPYAALTSGDILKAKTVLDVMQNGDLSDTWDVTKYGTLNAFQLASNIPSGRNSTLMAGAIANNAGIQLGTKALAELANSDSDVNKAIRAGEKTGQETEQNGIKQTESFTNNNMQTNAQLQEITMKNISNEFASLQGFLGKWYDTIVVAIKGIAGTLAAGSIGKGIGALAGSAGGGSGSGILASAGGGIALGTIGGVAAITAIGSAVADAMWSNSGEYGMSKAQEDLEGTSLEGNSAATSMLATTNAQNDSGWFQKTFGNVGAGISMLASNIFQGTSDKNKNFLQWAIQSGALDTGDQNKNNGYFLALATIYAQNGFLDSFNKGLQEAGIPASINSKEDIGSLIKEWGVSKDTLMGYINNVIDAGWGKINLGNGKSLTSFDINGADFGLTGVLGYRQGLDEVPYDNYPALLHEGEAVLTASTATELRSLIDEYRNTSKQSINFETIIQNQTNSLITKLEELRRTMEGTYTKEDTCMVNESNGAISRNNKQSIINIRNTKEVFTTR